VEIPGKITKTENKMEPKFNIVAIEETIHYSEEFQEKFGRIWGIYLYDETSVTQLCESASSYAFHYLRSVAENDYEDDEELYEANLDTDDIRYFHCGDIDSLPHENVVDMNDSDVDVRFQELEYEELLEEVLAYCGENDRVTEKMLQSPA
jgi:hypothetical protein